MNIFDTHFHLLPEDDLQEIVNSALGKGVTGMLVAGSPINQTRSMLERIASSPHVYAAVGVHPHEAEKFIGKIKEFRQLSQHPKVKAIGEIGLDYFYENSPVETQQRVFKTFLDLAVETNLPAIVHCRDAFEDCYQIIKERLQGNFLFVIHCFTGSKDWAIRFLDLGGYLSFNGILTFKTSERVRDVLKEIPTDRLLFETDSPYLAPVPFRGKKNEPANMVHIIERAAFELGMSFNELAEINQVNTCNFFRIPFGGL